METFIDLTDSTKLNDKQETALMLLKSWHCAHSEANFNRINRELKKNGTFKDRAVLLALDNWIARFELSCTSEGIIREVESYRL